MRTMYSKEDVEKWVDEHGDYLLRYAMTQVDDRHKALDFIQETYMSALKNVDSFEGRSAPRTWLVSILKRKIIDYWRKQKVRKTDVASHFFHEGGRDDGTWVLENAPTQSVDSAEDQITENEQIDEVHRCLEQLPPRSKAIMNAKYMDQKKGEVICKEYDVSSSNFWVIVHRAKLLLRDCLQQKWF